jgi:hypothetical protein
MNILQGIALFLTGLSLGMGLTNISWVKHCEKNNKEWYEYCQNLIEEFYGRRAKE